MRMAALRAALNALLVVVLLALPTAGGTPARAGDAAAAAPTPRDGALLPSAPVLPLLDWVAAQMGVPADDLFPPAVLLSGSILRTLDRDFLLSSDGYSMRAAYIPGAVVLDHEAWSWADPLQVSFLVHELVHHVQQLTRPGMACLDREREAYALQNRWLAGIAHPPIPVPAPDRMGCRP